MVSTVIITILCIITYLLVCYEFFSPDTQQTQGSSDNSQDNGHGQMSDDDIMGKSTFDVNAELRKKRERDEEKRRKEAIAKGEMTEDGKEIAQEVSVEDCEVETKREWKQVPTEELDVMFDETEVPVEGYADGNPINDIDLSLHIVTSLPNIGHEGMMGNLITDEEVANEWESSNLGAYSWLFPDQYVMIPILQDIIKKADAVLNGTSDRIADLRFGHDNCLGPLHILMGINGADRDPEDPYEVKN